MENDEITPLADQIAAKLQESLLKMPQEMVDRLKPYHGWSAACRLGMQEDEIIVDLRILADGALGILFSNVTGQPLHRLVLLS